MLANLKVRTAFTYLGASIHKNMVSRKDQQSGHYQTLEFTGSLAHSVDATKHIAA